MTIDEPVIETIDEPIIDEHAHTLPVMAVLVLDVEMIEQEIEGEK